MNLETHGDFAGRWLQNRHSRLFVSCMPCPRVLSFGLTGQDSPWPAPTLDSGGGVRTWFMEPQQTASSRLPGDQPGQFVECAESSAWVKAQPDPTTQLALEIEATLQPAHAAVHIVHRLRNCSSRPRDLALWSILGLPRTGNVTARSETPADPPGSLIFWPSLSREHPALRWSHDGVGIELTASPQAERPFKLGIRTLDGTLQWHYPTGSLGTKVTRSGEGCYPEGGGDCTLYAGRIAELEHVGPLTRILPGQAVTMEQSIWFEPTRGASLDSVTIVAC